MKPAKPNRSSRVCGALKLFPPQGGMLSLRQVNCGFETDLMIDASSWWVLILDSDSPWLMHMVSLHYQTIIIEVEVQIEERRYHEGDGLEAICHMNCQGP